MAKKAKTKSRKTTGRARGQKSKSPRRAGKKSVPDFQVNCQFIDRFLIRVGGETVLVEFQRTDSSAPELQMIEPLSEFVSERWPDLTEDQVRQIIERCIQTFVISEQHRQSPPATLTCDAPR